MFSGLHNQLIVVLLAIGIVMASSIVLGGSYFVLQAVMSPPDPLFTQVDWKSVPKRANQTRPVLISE